MYVLFLPFCIFACINLNFYFLQISIKIELWGEKITLRILTKLSNVYKHVTLNKICMILFYLVFFFYMLKKTLYILQEKQAGEEPGQAERGSSCGSTNPQQSLANLAMSLEDEMKKESIMDNIDPATDQEGVLPVEFNSVILAETEAINNDDTIQMFLIQQTQIGMEMPNNVRFVITSSYFCVYSKHWINLCIHT